MRASRIAAVRTLAGLAVCAALFAACRNPIHPEDAVHAADATSRAMGPAPLVTGTVLDAHTGKPLMGALVRGPGGVEAKSDPKGRFVLRGLALGASGELVATTEAGLAGRNLLRPLERGALEVVLYLR